MPRSFGGHDRTGTSELPYWLSGGSEECGACGGRHVVEMQLHCVACDDCLCMVCALVVRLSGETFCPTCAPEELR
jgi:hypothetical protein